MEFAEGIGAVAIGRNEGERLVRCLRSLRRELAHVVYVDSGSTDGSVAAARALGVEVVELDLTKPFTAARARNEGFRALTTRAPALRYVQFIDGDCELQRGWLAAAMAVIDRDESVVAVAGRRRERYPDASVWNRIVDIEWDTPVGETKSCGGDALMRVDAFRRVDGYDASLIAGEEPELCVRLRARGGRILRVDAEMTLHDAAIAELAQWWKRAVRSGHASAEAFSMHGAPPERHGAAETRRIVFFGAVLPATALALALPTMGASLGLFLGYPVSAYRAYRSVLRRGHDPIDAAAYAMAITLAKFAELEGATTFWKNRWAGRKTGLIEYK